MLIEAYDLLFKNMKEFCHQMAYKVATNGKNVPKIAVLVHFWCLIGPLVAKFFHILVEEVISFKMSGVTSKSDKYEGQK